jgi:hypothetical protein
MLIVVVTALRHVRASREQHEAATVAPVGTSSPTAALERGKNTNIAKDMVGGRAPRESSGSQ